MKRDLCRSWLVEDICLRDADALISYRAWRIRGEWRIRGA